ncbi:hypothetical protein [Bdellovibrio sp. HCB337]|uniref:hypothetical protein n=1 Tax=Bdellovibrio sp. HCB337 TaxID=3394358 RepID=UPI0039A686FC
MKSLLFSFVMLMGVRGYATPCDTNLVFTCEASYISQISGMSIITKKASAAFADENPYEPSLANCASTVYVDHTRDGDNSVVRIYANKDLESSQLTIAALGIQTYTRYENDENVTGAYYGDEVSVSAVVGQKFQITDLVLPHTIIVNDEPTSSVRLHCVAK